MSKFKKIKSVTLKGFKNNIVGEIDTETSESFGSDSEHLDENTDYRFVQSVFTYKLDDLEGIIVGGISSRFWQIRKYMNLLQQKFYNRDEKIPFYSWECITL